MNWRAFVLSTSLSVSLLPQIVRAQNQEDPGTGGEPEEKAAPEPAAAESQESTGKGMLGDVRIGPSVAAGIPHPVTAALDVVYADLLAVSFSAGRSGTELDKTELEIRNWDVALRWFPFSGSFFIGAAYGNQGVVGKRTVDLNVNASGVPLTVPTTVRLEIESTYLTPQIGWFARWDSGFTLGFDLGLQMPSGAKSELQTSFANVSAASEAAVRASEDYIKNKKDVEDAAEMIGKQALPYITLIRMGWLF
jgi:hypothetical protein